jgi:hypothetical protein
MEGQDHKISKFVKILYILKPNIMEKRLKDKIIYTIIENEKIEIFPFHMILILIA